MRHLFVLAIASLVLLSSGCFVFEEIDNGLETMRKHSPEPKASPAKVVADDSGLSFAALRERGKNALGELSGRVEEAMQKEPDPDNAVVKCEIEGRVDFTRKFDCQSRGGRVR